MCIMCSVSWACEALDFLSVCKELAEESDDSIANISGSVRLGCDTSVEKSFSHFHNFMPLANGKYFNAVKTQIKVFTGGLSTTMPVTVKFYRSSVTFDLVKLPRNVNKRVCTCILLNVKNMLAVTNFILMNHTVKALRMYLE